MPAGCERRFRDKYCQSHQEDDRPSEAISKPLDALNTLAGHGCQKHFFCDEGKHKRSGKGPPQQRPNAEPHQPLSGPQAAAPVHECRKPQHGRVHGKARGQVSGCSMVHAWAEDHGKDEEDRHALIECPGDD